MEIPTGRIRQYAEEINRNLCSLALGSVFDVGKVGTILYI